MALFKSKKTAAEAQVDMTRLPRHLAIIMDGNGRWAKKRGLPRTAGHAAGSETFRRIATACNDMGMEYLTVYAFSTENWKRPKEEVDAIMNLLEKYLYEAIDSMEKDNIQLHFFGDMAPLSDKLKELCRRTDEIGSHCTGLNVNVCLNYGGRDEILHAAKRYAQLCAEGKAQAEELNETVFDSLLYSAGTPDVDLVIRPSGEIRISNFLLWQSAYAEYYFTDVLWPDFDQGELMRALADYQHRSRRFGGV